MDSEAFLKVLKNAVDKQYNMEKHFEELYLRANAKCITATKGLAYDHVTVEMVVNDCLKKFRLDQDLVRAKSHSCEDSSDDANEN